MSDFHVFGKAVQEQFNAMSQGELFTVDIDGDELYAAYQAAFPAGTNEVFRKQREHECSTCRNFIKNIGAVVSINDNLTINTVWDNPMPVVYPYNQVVGMMNELIRSKLIKGLFRAEEPTYGGKPNKDNEVDIVWNHFYGKVDKKHHLGKGAAQSAAAAIGDYNNKLGVFKRAMTEFNLDSINTIVDLIESNNLYKGAEVKDNVIGLQKLFIAYNMLLTETQQNAFLFKNLQERGSIVKNSSIGTLIEDLSAGAALEGAVKAYEDKVSGTNYKRPTALITPRMVTDAMKTISDLGIEDSLHRRLATIEDVAVTDVMYVDNEVRSKMKGGVANLLMDAVAPAVVKPNAKTTDIGIEDFMSKVLGKAKKVEVLVSNAQQNSFAVLTAPIDPNAPNIFKWDNGFAWSYDGNIADSELRKRVQQAGGRVDGVLRFTHSWNHEKRNASLMDLHVFMPGSSAHPDGFHDKYPSGQRVGWNKRQDNISGGVQDVDYTTAAPVGYVPVENITFPDMSKLKEGKYIFKIHNWAHRDPTKGGFKAEIEFGGQIFQYERDTPLKHKEWITLAEATLKDGVFAIEHKLDSKQSSASKWGVKTEQFTRVDSVMLSPNYWGTQFNTGNKHFLFILEGCKTDVPARGIYNEFLKPEFDKHRKVFEVLGNKMMCEPTNNQLAGVGFSSTKKDLVTIRVNGHQLYNVQF